MKLAEQYAHAMLHASQKGTDTSSVLSALRSALARRGHQKLLPQVLKATAALSERESSVSVPELTVARESDAPKYKLAASSLLETDSAACTVRIDESLIGGFVYRQKGVVADGSYKRALVQLYRNITK